MVYGIGEARLQAFGTRVLSMIEEHCRERGLTMDVPSPRSKKEELPPSVPRLASTAAQAFELFRQGASVEDVVRQTGRAHNE